jgi:uncharacterized membrane protein YfcA
MPLAASHASFIILFFAAMWAGAQNALAGGGSFVTLPALMLTGMDARAANITSTIALFPAQLATGWTGRKFVSGVGALSFGMLVAVSLAGGALGALLLLVTPPSFFARLVPWLVLFATAIFAYGSFMPRREGATHLSRWGAMTAQFFIAIYGGYFGGGIGFLMLAALTAAGLAIRPASANKNVLAGVMNDLRLRARGPLAPGRHRLRRCGDRRRGRRADGHARERETAAGLRGPDRHRADDRAVPARALTVSGVTA